MSKLDDDEVVTTLDRSLLRAAIYSNSFRSLAPSYESTGFRTGALRNRALSTAPAAAASSAEEFLLASRMTRNDREATYSIESYLSDPGVAMLALHGRESNAGLKEVELPPRIDLRMKLGQAFQQRRSARLYTGDRMRFEELATIIRSVAEVTGESTVQLFNGDTTTLQLRTTASGGALYPVDVYCAAIHVDGLKPGIYRFSPRRSSIFQMGDHTDVASALRAFSVPEEMISISRSCAVFLLVARMWKSVRKYGNRGLRFALIEVGAMTERIHLSTLALGFGSVDCASYFDDELHEALQLDGINRAVLHTVVVGAPA